MYEKHILVIFLFFSYCVQEVGASVLLVSLISILSFILKSNRYKQKENSLVSLNPKVSSFTSSENYKMLNTIDTFCIFEELLESETK